MNKRLWYFLQHIIPLMVLVTLLVSGALAAAPPAGPPGDRLAVTGLLKNPQGRAVKDVEVEFLVNGHHVKPLGEEKAVTTGKSGAFVAELQLPTGALPGARVEVTAQKPSWRVP